MKLPLSTTVSTVPPYRRLTAAKAITATVLQNARPPMPTTAGTGATTVVLTVASPIGAIALLSAKPVMLTIAGTERRQTVLTAVSPIGAIVLLSAKPVMLTIAGTELPSSLPVRQTQPAPISPTAPPKLVPGPATPVINKKEALVSWLDQAAILAIFSIPITHAVLMLFRGKLYWVLSYIITVVSAVKLRHRGRLIRMVIKPAATQRP